MSTQPKNNEEVDLGSLFVIIGNGFSKLFSFVGSIFAGLYHVLILSILFLRNHATLLLIAVALGAGGGAILELTKEQQYASDMLLKPNFNSVRQLYNNINFYNDLVEQKDTLSLASTFGISKDEAASLKKFEIEAVVNQNDIVSSYDDLILSVDTLTAKAFTFEEFKSTFTYYDYKIHKVHVRATKNNIFTKLDDVIIESIISNSYFNTLKKLNDENINRTDSLLRKSLTQVDSLRKVYMQVMLEESKKQSTGTTIDLGGQLKTTKEIELFETNKRLSNDLKEITEDRAEKSEVLNVISNFQPIGYELKGIGNNYIMLLSLVAAGTVLLILVLRELNAYLNTYKK